MDTDMHDKATFHASYTRTLRNTKKAFDYIKKKTDATARRRMIGGIIEHASSTAPPFPIPRIGATKSQETRTTGYLTSERG